MKYTLFLFAILFYSSINGQNTEAVNLPYHQIPEYPGDYTSGNVISRFIDGLGYRYYWATEGLREEDLSYKPSDDSRDALHTLNHLHGLSQTILNGAKDVANVRPANAPELTFEELRAKTLQNFKEASELALGKDATQIAELSIIFQRGENKNEFPFWNMMNGPIADAIYHVGQIVAFRRASGNPINPGVNVFIGKTKE